MKNHFADLHAPTGYQNVALVMKLLDSTSSKGFFCELQLDLKVLTVVPTLVLEFSTGNEKHRAGHDNYKRSKFING